jgi:hypothetical protein
MQVLANVFYNDLSYELLDETPAYPLEEMINELAGIFGLYFGFSIISLAPLFHLAYGKVLRTFPRVNFQNGPNLNNQAQYCSITILLQVHILILFCFKD